MGKYFESSQVDKAQMELHSPVTKLPGQNTVVPETGKKIC